MTTVEAAIVHENGRLTFVAADTKQHGLKHGPAINAVAWCDLKADVVPDPIDPRELCIPTVYACSQFSDFFQPLTGEDAKVAEAILLANEGWLEWAHSEIASNGPKAEGYQIPVRV